MTDETRDPSIDADAPAGSTAASPVGPIGRALKDVVAADFAQYGPDAVKALRLERPHDYLKLVASLEPKESPHGNATVEDMTDDEFSRVLDVVRSLAAENGSGPDRGQSA